MPLVLASPDPFRRHSRHCGKNYNKIIDLIHILQVKYRDISKNIAQSHEISQNIIKYRKTLWIYRQISKIPLNIVKSRKIKQNIAKNLHNRAMLFSILRYFRCCSTTTEINNHSLGLLVFFHIVHEKVGYIFGENAIP